MCFEEPQGSREQSSWTHCGGSPLELEHRASDAHLTGLGRGLMMTRVWRAGSQLSATEL